MGTQEYFETVGHIEGGQLKLSGRLVFDQAMRRFGDGPVTVRVSALLTQRSHMQNRYWHGILIPIFMEHTGYSFEEMKDALALHLIPQEITDLATGEITKVPGHTSRLSKKEFTDLIERAQQLGAEMNIYIPSPGEVAVP